MLMQFLSPDTEFWEIPVFEVNNQHILVTGGSSGLGRHFALFLASNGAKVTLAARRADALASVVADINKSDRDSYLLSARAILSAVRGVKGLDEETSRKVEFYTKQFIDALAP